MALFQKRHYELLADTLRASAARSNHAHDTIVREIADALERDNSRFNKARFLAACGMYHEAVKELIP